MKGRENITEVSLVKKKAMKRTAEIMIKSNRKVFIKEGIFNAVGSGVGVGIDMKKIGESLL